MRNSQFTLTTVRVVSTIIACFILVLFPSPTSAGDTAPETISGVRPDSAPPLYEEYRKNNLPWKKYVRNLASYRLKFIPNVKPLETTKNRTKEFRLYSISWLRGISGFVIDRKQEQTQVYRLPQCPEALRKKIWENSDEDMVSERCGMKKIKLKGKTTTVWKQISNTGVFNLTGTE
ncbi:MAG: hypothetical protein ABEJ65_08525, partial [bacterium]